MTAKKACPLQDELKQRKPFESVTQAALVGLLRTSDLVGRKLAAVVEPGGITLQQFNVLRILRGAGGEGLPTLDVAARMIEQTPGVTRLLDRLEAKGFIRRQRCAKDRRQHLCWITEEGKELLQQLEKPVAQAGDEIVRGLSGKQRAQLARLLDAVRAPHAGA